jgi:UDP-glucose 4-epimerase
MIVTVTGGGGFIGSNLVRRLIEGGVDVKVLDDFSTGDRRNLQGCEAAIFAGSILDSTAARAAVEGADAVVHLAALPSVPRSVADPISSHHANATGTLTMLEAVRQSGCPHFIVASSSSVYGRNPRLPKREDQVPMPASPYAVSKLAAESYALAYGECFGLDILALRFFNVYGPFQRVGHAYGAVVPAFVSAALRGQELHVNGDGTQTRDFTFVGTVVTVLEEALAQRISAPTPVNLGFGARVSLLELIATLEELIGRSVESIHDPPRPGDVHDSEADGAHLRSLFPDVTPESLESGLRSTVAWHRSLEDVSSSPH